MTASAGKTGPSDGCGGFVGRPAGRQVDSENRRALLPRSHSSAASARPFSGGLKPVPSTASTMRSASSASLWRSSSSRARHDVDRAAHGAGQFAPRHGGVARQLLRRAEQQRGYVEAGIGEQPRRHHAIAAVVAASAEHGHAPRMRELLPRKSRHSRRGRAHQLNRRNPKPLRGGAVAGLHLGCGQNVHRNSIDTDTDTRLPTRRAISAIAPAEWCAHWRGKGRRPRSCRSGNEWRREIPAIPASGSPRRS